jgi:hypothetical protein
MSLTAAEVDGAEIGSPNELVVGDSICLKLTDDGLIIPGKRWKLSRWAYHVSNISSLQMRLLLSMDPKQTLGCPFLDAYRDRVCLWIMIWVE